MYFGAELVKVTPMDFLRDMLLWAKLIDKYKGTMTAAPELRLQPVRQAAAQAGEARSVRPVVAAVGAVGRRAGRPADVEDLCEAGAPFGLRPEAIMPAYGMAETTVAVSFSECGGGMVVDEVDADLLAVLHRAVPATKGNTRRLVTLGRPLQGLEVRVVDEDGSMLRRAASACIQVRGEPVTSGYTTVGRVHRARRTSRAGTTPATWATSPRPATSWCAGGSRTSSSWPAATSTRPTSSAPPPGWTAFGRAAPWRCGWTPGCRGRHSRWRSSPRTDEDPAEVRRIERQVAHEVFAEVDVRPRNVVVLEPGTIPKTPSGKLRRAHALALVS